MITLKEGDLISFDNRLFRLEYSAYYNRKEGKGRRVILKLLNRDEITSLLLNNNNTEVKTENADI